MFLPINIDYQFKMINTLMKNISEQRYSLFLKSISKKPMSVKKHYKRKNKSRQNKKNMISWIKLESEFVIIGEKSFMFWLPLVTSGN